MLMIGENIHIISKQVKQALENYDENFIKNLIKIQNNCDVLDFNIGPAKGKLDNIFEWLLGLCNNQRVSFDTSNIQALRQGLSLANNSNLCFINSTNADDEKLNELTDLALEYDCNLVALSMSKQTGIPKDSDGRMELVFKIYEKCLEKGINSDKLYFDPLVLPIRFEQSQASEVINTIKIIQESFEPKVNTIIGLSNISNGITTDLRPLINRVYAVLCYGAGLNSMIVDAKDTELFRIIKMLECNNPQNDGDKLYMNLSNMVQCFGDIKDIEYDKENILQCNIMRAARVLLNEEVFSSGLYV